VVPIFTYRDERKLFAVIGAIIVAALIALVQIDAARAGKPSFLSSGATSFFGFFQTGLSAGADATRNAIGSFFDAPHLAGENASLSEHNRALEAENARLREALSREPAAAAIERAAAREPGGIVASAIGFDPENQSRIVTIDKGSRAGVRVDAGVVDESGVVGRIVGVEPFTSKVLLLTDATSKVPAVVQRGRWWGIATGTNTRVQLQYVSQDAKLRRGDVIVTGEGRSFHAGVPIGRIVQVFHSEGALYQTAVVEPAVSLGRLSRVLVLQRR
jgi:rod shape-determining protein MreC